MSEKSSKNVLGIIFFIVFVDLLGFGILIPVIPLLLTTPSSPYYILPHNIPVTTGYIYLGLLTAIYPLMMFLAAPIFGQLSDRYGRKKLLATAVAGSAVAYFVFAIGIVLRSLPLLFVARAFDGITGGNIAIAQAAIADVTEPKDRAKNFGLVGAAFGLGFIIGPFIGGQLSNPGLVSWFNAATPFYFAALLSTFELCLIVFILPETLKEKIKGYGINLFKSISNIIEVFKHKSIRSTLVVVFLFMMGFTFFTSFVSVYYIQRFNFNQGSLGDLFAYIGIWIAFAQLFVTRRLPQQKEIWILRIALVGMAIMLFVIILPTAPWQLLLIFPFFAIFNGVVQAYLVGLVSRSADSTIQGQVLGINSSVMALAQVLPPIIAGFAAVLFTPVFPLYVGSIITFIAAIVFWVYVKPPTSTVGNAENSPAMAH